MRNLEGTLADYNLAFDKQRTNTRPEDIRNMYEYIKVIIYLYIKYNWFKYILFYINRCKMIDWDLLLMKYLLKEKVKKIKLCILNKV